VKQRVKGLADELRAVDEAEPTIEDAVEMFRRLSGKVVGQFKWD